MIGRTIEIDQNYCNYPIVNDYGVKHKLILEKCKKM
jgi:hypothetical protein